jgi:superoxide reductase
MGVKGRGLLSKCTRWGGMKVTALNQVYRCSVCGNVSEVLHTGVGTLVCCGKPMVLLVEKTEKDELKEKHVPVVTKTADGIRVAVGSLPHPMEEKHHIEWVQIIYDSHVCRTMLYPGKPAEATFGLAPAQATARAYCNIHGLWKTGV